MRRLSIRITRVLLPTGISANQTTVLGILIGLAGAALLAVNEYWAQILAIALLQLSFVLDFCDGEIARFEREIEGVSSGAGGAYLDWVGHYYIPAVMTGALGWAVFHETGDWWWPALALVVILSLVRVPYSARDHIMWGVYRDRPELRDSEPMVRAALARMGGDPEALDLEPDAGQRMAGGEGRGWLWSRYTNFGQLIVFPGFVNLVAAAVVIDMLLSAAASSVEDDRRPRRAAGATRGRAPLASGPGDRPGISSHARASVASGRCASCSISVRLKKPVSSSPSG